MKGGLGSGNHPHLHIDFPGQELLALSRWGETMLGFFSDYPALGLKRRVLLARFLSWGVGGDLTAEGTAFMGIPSKS